MAGQAASMFAHPFADKPHSGWVVQLALPRPPANVGQEPEPRVGSRIGNSIRRRRIESNRVDACVPHCREVIDELREWWKRFAFIITAEAAVRHPFNPEPLATEAQEFSFGRQRTSTKPQLTYGRVPDISPRSKLRYHRSSRVLALVRRRQVSSREWSAHAVPTRGSPAWARFDERIAVAIVISTMR